VPTDAIFQASSSELWDVKTVNPKDVWEPTELERFASPVANMLESPVVLPEAQKCMALMGENSSHYETELGVLGYPPDAATTGMVLSHPPHRYISL
jgi:hypothetical protein